MNVDVKLCSICHTYKPLCAYYKTFHGLLECEDCNQGKEDNVEYYPPDMICCNKCNDIFLSKDHALSLSIGNKNEAYCKNCAPKIIENLGVFSVQPQAVWERIKEPYIKWVSVKDRIPEEDSGTLLVLFKDNSMNLAYWCYGVFNQYDPEFRGINVLIEGVTHWIDLDDIPKPEGE